MGHLSWSRWIQCYNHVDLGPKSQSAKTQKTKAVHVADQLMGLWRAMCLGKEGVHMCSGANLELSLEHSRAGPGASHPEHPDTHLLGGAERRLGCGREMKLKQGEGGAEAREQCQRRERPVTQNCQGREGPYSLGSFSTCRATEPAS